MNEAELERNDVQQAIGFTNITEIPFEVPLRLAPRDKTLESEGRIELVHVPEALKPCVLLGVTSVLGVDYNEFQALLACARKELRDPKMHSTSGMYPCKGRTDGALRSMTKQHHGVMMNQSSPLQLSHTLISGIQKLCS